METKGSLCLLDIIQKKSVDEKKIKKIIRTPRSSCDKQWHDKRYHWNTIHITTSKQINTVTDTTITLVSNFFLSPNVFYDAYDDAHDATGEVYASF